MKIILLFFFFLISCIGIGQDKIEKIYICGDHECTSKKEINEYFKNNISIEVYSISKSSKRNKDFDLVELNLSKNEKKKLVWIAKQRDEIKKNLKTKDNFKRAKINEGEKNNKIQHNIKNSKKPKITLVRICKNIQECDIDNVEKIVSKMANEKKFPNLSFK